MTTDPTPTADDVPEPPERTEETPEASEGTETAEGDDKPASSREAKYRRQLRDTEADRDRLVERLGAMQRSEAERLAGQVLDKPAALWAAGADLADLLDADGAVDPAKVTDAARAALDHLGLRPRLSNHVPREGGNPDSVAGDRFVDAFG